MVTASISNISEKIISKKTYTVEELLSILLQYVNYNVEIEEFSDLENKELLKQSKFEEISSLID